MCTVTFIPKDNSGFILISNRDEAPNRQTLSPNFYEIDGVKMLFPKDEVAGGTWFGVSERKRLICLLNGGFVAHQRAVGYRLSRGVVVNDLLGSLSVPTLIETYNFNGIEPFTVVMVEWSIELQLFELVWDGTKIHFSEKAIAPNIWSSSLLYSEDFKKKRRSWFADFMSKNLQPSEADLLQFHKTAGDGDSDSNLIMDRGFVKTKSITLFSKSANLKMRYEDLTTQEVTKQQIGEGWEIN